MSIKNSQWLSYVAVLGLLFTTTISQAQNTHQTAETKFIPVNGARFAYRSFGKNNGLPIVLLQHFTGTMDNWDPLLTDGLAQTHRVILFDNRGIGSSEGEAPETVEAMANDAIAFIHALGLKKVDLLGFSLGGFVAQKIVIIEPTLVNKLILAGTGPEGGDIADNGPVIQNKENLTPQQMLLHLFYDTAAISQNEGKAAIARLGLRTVNRDANTKVPSILAQNKAIEAFRDKKDANFPELAKITQPVLVVNGVRDIMVPTQNSYTLATHIKNSKLVIYPTSGHGALFQYHDDFVKQVNIFLQ